MLINELEAAEPDESFYDAKVKVLSELIEHHVKEEEKQRDNLFQQTRAADIDLEALGDRLAARKAELIAKAESEGLPPAEPATLQHEGDLSMAWTRTHTILAGAGAAVAGFAAALFARRRWGGDGEEVPAAGAGARQDRARAGRPVGRRALGRARGDARPARRTGRRPTRPPTKASRPATRPAVSPHVD